MRTHQASTQQARSELIQLCFHECSQYIQRRYSDAIRDLAYFSRQDKELYGGLTNHGWGRL